MQPLSVTNSITDMMPHEHIQGVARTAKVDASKATRSEAASEDLDIAPSAVEISQLLSKVKALPEVRNEVVESFREEVNAGGYPPPVLIEGLARLLGTAESADLQDPDSPSAGKSDS